MSKKLPNSTEKSNKRAAMYEEPQKKELIADSVKRVKLEAKNVENYMNFDAKSQTTIFHLHSDIWRVLFEYISENDVIALSSVCKQMQETMQNTKSGFNLRKNYRLDVECLLNYALSKSCTSIDISYCEWLTPSAIIEMISKTNLHHLHLIQCQMNEDCVRSICSLQLQSLSFTFTYQWRSYFTENIDKSPFFVQTLNKLEIENGCWVSHILNRNIMFTLDVYNFILQHCKELQHLKIVDKCRYKCNDSQKKFPAQSTSLLKLISLEVVNKPSSRIFYTQFLKAILQDKVIPLKNVDFGPHTCHLLNDGILLHPLILPNKSRLVLRHSSDDGGSDNYLVYEDNKDNISKWINRSTYETIFIENLKFNDLAPFADQIVSASKKPIKQVHIHNCLVDKNFLKSIELFAIHCPQITVLHLVFAEKAISINEIQRNFNTDKMAENEAILEALTNFKNLKELAISPSILTCKYYNEISLKMETTILPFWKVTQSCAQLKELRLECPSFSLANSVHVDNLRDIAHCKNLRVLMLNDLTLVGNKDFPFSQITKSCVKLEHISFDIDRYSSCIINLEDSLDSLKFLKMLTIKSNVKYLTETFLNSLCFCEKLENLYIWLRGTLNERENVIINVFQVLPKLKNVFTFRILSGLHCRRNYTKELKSCFETIKKERPTVSGYIL